MTNYIFDLYGTLIDIHTSESKASLEGSGFAFFDEWCALYGNRAA